MSELKLRPLEEETQEPGRDAGATNGCQDCGKDAGVMGTEEGRVKLPLQLVVAFRFVFGGFYFYFFDGGEG
jgi:hypothetical protein